MEVPEPDDQKHAYPEFEVPVDLETEKNEQKSVVDRGSSPWKLDPIFVAQVFVSLKVSPEGITGDYPIEPYQMAEHMESIKANPNQKVIYRSKEIQISKCIYEMKKEEK